MSEWRFALSTAALERVAPGFRQPLTKFSKRLAGLFEARLLSWTIFGPAAAGEQPTAERRAQHVLMLDRIDLEKLRQLAPAGQIFGPVGLAAPLVMTPAYVQTSLDAFPLEFIEISQRHVTLCGDEPFADLEFRDADVRLACEREVKGLLLGMRQGLLRAGDDPARLAEVEEGAMASVARLLEGLLWLKGERAYLSPHARLDQVERVASRSFDAMRAALEPRSHCDWQAFCNLYEDLESLRKIIDAW